MKKLILAFICLLPLLASQAKTITVDDDDPADFDNIPDAIGSAVDGDVITVNVGTYNQSVSFYGAAVTLTSEDPNDPNIVQATIISTSTGYSVNFGFEEGNDSVLTGFTVTGRGIRCYGTSPTISKNIIRDCQTRGIHGENDATPIISDNTIRNNSQQGIYYCDGPITNNIVTENEGGIAYCHGPITNNVISNNAAILNRSGGALLFCRGQISGNLIADNYAAEKGGACYECPGSITNNIFIGNSSTIAGGALCNCYGEVGNNIIVANRCNSGGGLFGCSNVYNNTIVGNIAYEKGGAFNQAQGYIRNNIIAFNKAGDVGGINGQCLSSNNVFWLNEGGNFGGGVVVGVGDINANPRFAAEGYWDPNGTPDDESDDFWVDGDYHVKSETGRWDPVGQLWVMDDVTSRCVDGGEPHSDWTGELWPHGKRINVGAYGGTAQASMSLSDIGNVADLNPDLNDANDWVDYTDLAVLTHKWLSDEVPLAADLDRDGLVDLTDLAILLNNWQPQPPPPQPPTPDPMTWATPPSATSITTIAMTATIATSTDGSGVEYYFFCSTPGGHDSDWQVEPTYTDVGLTPDTQYTYQVKARNRTNRMETAYSDPCSATTPPDDTTPPSPDPATWETEPYAPSATSIRMVATTASDENGVEYYFECTSHPVYSSKWQASPVYEVSSVPKGADYSFVTRTRDKSPNRNTTGDSTEVTVDLDPPEPDPMQWASGGQPRKVYHGGGKWDYWAEMTAAEATDPSGGVQYLFICTSEPGFSSGWQSSRTHSVQLGGVHVYATFCVKARDAFHNETGISSKLPAN